MKIKRISYDTAKKFVNDKTLILQKQYIYYGLFNKELVSILGIKYTGYNKAKLHCNYTPEELRGNSYFSILLKSVIEKIKKEHNSFIITADCTDYSKNIYKNAGFKVKYLRIYKNFNITTMEFKYGKTKN